MEAFKKEKGIGRKKDLIFYCLILIWPVLQFCIFYIYVNFNSFLLAFKDIKMDLNADSISKYTYTFSGKAFADLWELLKTKTIREAGLISLLTYGLSLFITMPLGLLFSFYISKKHFGAGFFQSNAFPSVHTFERGYGYGLHLFYKSGVAANARRRLSSERGYAFYVENARMAVRDGIFI